MKIWPGCAAAGACGPIGSAAADVAACAEVISEGQAGRRIAAFSTGNADRSLATSGGSVPWDDRAGTGTGAPAKMTGTGAVGIGGGAGAAAATIAVGDAARTPPGFGPAAAI